MWLLWINPDWHKSSIRGGPVCLLAQIYWSARGPWELETGEHKCRIVSQRWQLVAYKEASAKREGDTGKQCAALSLRTGHQNWKKSSQECVWRKDVCGVGGPMGSLEHPSGWPGSVRGGCPSRCTCRPEAKEVICSGKHLNSVPEAFPAMPNGWIYPTIGLKLWGGASSLGYSFFKSWT
ncbi:hypothetical protein WMY93_026565 [Mugilogobius chulae]|uniref:Uncharacterized protein n=1 Tax=Mugilogobius chulae TaxID=88201 RepID=A0AAW0MZE4_9GOBI